MNFCISLKSASKNLLWFRFKKIHQRNSHNFDQTLAGGMGVSRGLVKDQNLRFFNLPLVKIEKYSQMTSKIPKKNC